MLGSILLDDSFYIQAAGTLEANDFSLEKHRRIFNRMGDLYERGEQIDRITVANELMKFSELESCDGLSYLVSLDDGLPQIPNLDSYIRMVKDKAILRSIIFASQHMINRCMMAEEAPDEILAGAEETLLKLGEAQVKSGLLNPDEILRGLRRRHQRLPRPQQARQGRQHRLPQARRDNRRPARRRSVHPGRAPVHGQDRLRAEHRAARGAAQQADGGRLLARNVEGVAADPHAVRRGARGQPAIPHRLPLAGRAPQAQPCRCRNWWRRRSTSTTRPACT